MLSTLFPYTTLFRSDFMCNICFFDRSFRTLNTSYSQLALQTRIVNTIIGRGFFFHMKKNPLPIIVFTDRKSTRLNSSHEWISYAVFCLKKKKKNTIYTGRMTHWTSTRDSQPPSAILQQMTCLEG